MRKIHQEERGGMFTLLSVLLPDGSPAVAKIAALDAQRTGPPTSDKVFAAAQNECRILRTCLADIQGSIVPKFIGLYASKTFVLSIQSDAGGLYGGGHLWKDYTEAQK